LIDEVTFVVSRAGAAVLKARAGELATRTKADSSPVTAADEASEAIIMAGLATLCPGVPVVSEEAVSSNMPAMLADAFFLLDPVDGTHELIAGRDEFSINLALIRGGQPVFGIVAGPALGLVWRGMVNSGAERMRLSAGARPRDALERAPIRTRPAPATGLVAAVSRSHLDPQTQAFLARLAGAKQVRTGSAVKFCHV